jgi:hypothetical protein
MLMDALIYRLSIITVTRPDVIPNYVGGIADRITKPIVAMCTVSTRLAQYLGKLTALMAIYEAV